MRGDVMSGELSMTDRVRRWSYLQDVELWLEPMANRRRREIVRELRSNLADAAADVGMTQAISDLGRPRDLAREYVQAEPRRRPNWSLGVLALGAVLLISVLALLSYLAGMADALIASGGGTAEGSFLGLEVVTEASQTALAWELTGWSWPLAIAALLALLLGAQVWRYLPRRR
jgi:hypothetical protein